MSKTTIKAAIFSPSAPAMFRFKLHVKGGSTVASMPTTYRSANEELDRLLENRELFEGGHIEEKIPGLPGWYLCNGETYCSNCDTYADLMGGRCVCGRVQHTD